MPSLPSIFDILGPIMIGPSSSHTAGASRIGFIARQLLGGDPQRAVITLYNSFAKTHKGHGTDLAVVGGILGFGPDDTRIRESFDLARKQGLQWEFKFVGDLARFHSNTARIRLIGWEGDSVEIVGVSLGGGRIRIQEIEGFEVNFDAHTFTLVLIAEDVPGSIRSVSGVLAEQGINIAHMTVSRTGNLANMVLELDHEADRTTLSQIRGLAWVRFARLVEPVVEGSSRYLK